MAKDRTRSPEEEDDQLHDDGAPSKPRHTSNRKLEDEPQPDSVKHKSSRSSKRRSKSRRNYSDDDDSYSSSSYDSDSDSDRSDHSSEDSGSETEEQRKRRKRRERKKREEKEKEKRRRRRREKEKMKKRKRRDRDDEEDKKEKKTKKHKKKKDDKGKMGAVTNSWGKYGIIKDSDMWNKRPEFTAWLLEVKQVNLESLPNWEEKQMFKQFMEDHNTATFPSKKYYNLDAYHRNKLEKQMKKGFKKVVDSERIIFDDEEQRRLELQRAREKQKEVEIEALKRSMQTGMAQAMKDQARLKEEMAYQYKLGNMEAAAAIQRRLDPDVPS